VFVSGAVSGVEAVAIVVIVFGLCFVPGAVTALKGHVALFVVGFFFGVVWLFAAFRLAKPSSPWANRFYSQEKLNKARARYPKTDPDAPDRSKLALTIGFGLIAVFFVVGLLGAGGGS
jgi:hypothetical protein